MQQKWWPYRLSAARLPRPCSALFKSNTLHFIIIFEPYLALETADLKNNGEFRFDISKSIKIDINLPNKNFQFYPLLELYFAPR